MQASEYPLVHDLVPTVPAWDGRQADVFFKGLPGVGDMCMGKMMIIIRECLEKDFFEVAIQNSTIMGSPLPSSSSSLLLLLFLKCKKKS